MTGWLRPRKGGVEVTLRLTPRSSSNKIEGLSKTADGTAYLAARVRAVPEKGKANTALEELVAKWAGAAKRDVSVTAGGTSRIKTVFISGDTEELASRLMRLAEQ